jgi:hypothetical protein
MRPMPRPVVTGSSCNMGTTTTAFDPAAPEAERLDALRELQSQYAGRAHLDDSTIEAVHEVARYGMLQKANNVVVPFPNAHAKKHGMQSVYLDDMQIQLMGDWYEKRNGLSFDGLREMVRQTPILNAIVMTRQRQVQRFTRVNDSGEGLGFTVRHIDKDHQVSKDEQASIRELNRFFSHCGWESNPRARRAMRRDSFTQFILKSVRDSLTMDSTGIETEMKRDRALGIDGFYAVDGATIRLCNEDGYQGHDEIFALQVVQGRISTAYSFDDLIYLPRNPTTDVEAVGYGTSEVELLVRVVTGFLNAMTYNLRGFDANAIPRGILHLSGNYSNEDLTAFKRYWNSMVKGINNAWTLPVMVSKDQESKAAFENFGIEFNEMYFAKWMTFLTSLACAIFGISPSEINFDSFTGGNTSALSGSDTEEKLIDSKDKGLRPLLSYYEDLFTDYMLSAFSDKYVFRWTGLDEEDKQVREERAKLVLTVNEMRAQEGYDKAPDDWGDAPLNPSLIGVWQQAQQAAQPQDFGQPPDGGAGGDQPPPMPGGDDGQDQDAQPPDDGPDFGRGGPPQDFGKEQDQDFGKGFTIYGV